MPNLNENTSLLSPVNPANMDPPSFLQNLQNDPYQYLKKISLAGLSAFSGYMYWPSSFSAAALGGLWLQYLAALGGSITNGIFNYEAFLSFAELPKFRNIPMHYLSATFFSIACVAPNFFMNIYDDKKEEYVDTTDMLLQGSTAFLNIWVNIVGSLALIDNLTLLIKNKTAREKKQFLERFDQAIVTVAHKEELNYEAQKKLLLQLLNDNEELMLHQKVSLYALTAGITLLSTPQYVAYVLISYFGMNNLASKAWNANEATSITLALIAAIGNGIPGAGFSIKGVNVICKKFMSLEKPSLLAILFILPALFSGFTTQKAMADSLKELTFSGNTAELLNWVANLGAALIYNLPQMLALANRLGKDTTVPASLQQLQQEVTNKVEKITTREELSEFKRDWSHHVISFFQLPSNCHSVNGSNELSIPLNQTTLV